MAKSHGYISAVIGAVCLVAAIAAFFAINAVLTSQIKKARIVDSTGHENYDSFINDYDEDAAEVYMDYKFFTFDPRTFGGTAAGLTQALLQGTKIGVIESPKYVYRKYVVKDQVAFEEGGNIVSYKDRTFRVFDAAKSAEANKDYTPAIPGLFTGDPLKDTVTHFNPWMIGAMTATSSTAGWAAAYAVSDVIRTQILNCAFTPGTCTLANPLNPCITQAVGLWAGANGISIGAAGATWSTSGFGFLHPSDGITNFATFMTLADLFSKTPDAQKPAFFDSQITSKWSYFTLANIAEYQALTAYWIGQITAAGNVLGGLILGGQTSLVETQTVDTWLFGWSDPLLALLNPSCCDAIYNGRRGSVCPAMKTGLQSNASTTAFTATTGKTTKLRTGKDDADAIGVYTQYEDQICITAWKDCGPVRGTGGTGFKIGMKENDDAEVWVSQVEHPLVLEFKNTAKVEGIKTLEYRLKESELDQASQGLTSDRGMFSIGKIASGIPFILSKHNFLDAGPAGDNKYGSPFGITPEEGLHDTYIRVEPIVGVSMDVHKRLQINVNTTRLSATQWAGFPAPFTTYWEGVYPYVKVDEYGHISPEDADTFKKKVLTTKKIALGLLIAFLLIGVILVIIGFVCLFKSGNAHDHDKAAKVEAMSDSSSEDLSSGAAGSSSQSASTTSS